MTKTDALLIIRKYLLGALVVMAPLSLYPSIGIPLLNFPSFRIGLYQVLAILFVVVSLPPMWRQLRRVVINRWFTGLSLAMLLTMIIGIVYSLVPLRSLLYASSFLSLGVLGFAAWSVFPTLTKNDRSLLIRWLFWSGSLFGGLALGQLVLITYGYAHLTTLCATCSDAVFGFPRINLFAAEPQFFANSLLPILIATLMLDQPRRRRYTTLIVTSLAFACTFSRGAFIAIIVTVGVYGLYLLLTQKRQRCRTICLRFGIMMISICIGFGLLIASASYIHRETPYITYNTTVSALEHLTLGIVSLPQKHTTPTTPQSPTSPSLPTVERSQEQNFQPPGLIEASSNDRTGSATLALSAWMSTPRTLLFGVGMGNLGAYVTRYIKESAPTTLTVYIFYVLLLAELGIIGLGVFGITALLLLRYTASRRQPISRYVCVVIFAFLLHFWFFGSYINVMYIYVWMGIGFALAIHQPTTHNKDVRDKKIRV